MTVNGQPPAPGTVTLTIDGAPQLYTAPVHVTGDGSHTATAQTADGSATTTFFVDSGPPVITLTTPSAGGAVAQGSSATPGLLVQRRRHRRADVRLERERVHHVGARLPHVHGHRRRQARQDVERIGDLRRDPHHDAGADATYARTRLVNADFGCADADVHCKVTKPGGGTSTVTSGNALPTDIPGGYTLAVTLTTAPATAPRSRAATRSARRPRAGKIVFTQPITSGRSTPTAPASFS